MSNALFSRNTVCLHKNTLKGNLLYSTLKKSLWKKWHPVVFIINVCKYNILSYSTSQISPDLHTYFHPLVLLVLFWIQLRHRITYIIILISRCDDNTYGVNCQDVCDCDNAGTALCSHVDGKCFCNANYFGDKCQMFCPFGYDKMNGCLKSLEVNMYYEFWS